MFQGFLDVADYWFGYFDDSSVGSYDPTRECFVVVVDDKADSANMAGAGDGEAPQNPGPSAPPTLPTGGMSISAAGSSTRAIC
jgi:hypothetical protein